MEQQKNLMEKAYLEIKNMIFLQKISPGQKLIYRELAERLEMSKTPVMYALGRLEQEGFVELIPNLGYSVREIDIKELEDLFDFRQALEAHSIVMAIKNQTNESLEALELKIQKHREYLPPIYDRKKLVLDAEVHCQIAQISGNRVLLRQLRQLFEHIYLRHRVELMNPARILDTPKEHEQILAYIREKDYDAAFKLLEIHIREAKENMVARRKKEEESALDLTVATEQ